MTMTHDEKLAMARECAAEAKEGSFTAHLAPECIEEIREGGHDDWEEVQSALLAIDRMQERVRAETERLQPPADVFDTAFVLQQIGRQATNTDVRQVAAWVLSTAIRETPHAEG